MLEKLREQRQAYADLLVELENADVEAIKQERFEAVKQAIAEQVDAELNAKKDEVATKIAHYDFVIAELEAQEQQAEEKAEDNTENMGE